MPAPRTVLAPYLSGAPSEAVVAVLVDEVASITDALQVVPLDMTPYMDKHSKGQSSSGSLLVELVDGLIDMLVRVGSFGLSRVDMATKSLDARAIAAVVEARAPALVLATDLFAAALWGEVAAVSSATVPSMLLPTDYRFDLGLAALPVSLFVVPHESMVARMEEAGIPSSRVRVGPLPIHPDLVPTASTKETRERFGFGTRPVISFFTEGMERDTLEGMIFQLGGLPEEPVILFHLGEDDPDSVGSFLELQAELHSLDAHIVQDDSATVTLLASSSVAIGSLSPGLLTVAFGAGVPVGVVAPGTSAEVERARLLVDSGAGFLASDTLRAGVELGGVLGDPRVAKRMAEAGRTLAPPWGARRLAELVVEAAALGPSLVTESGAGPRPSAGGDVLQPIGKAKASSSKTTAAADDYLLTKELDDLQRQAELDELKAKMARDEGAS